IENYHYLFMIERAFRFNKTDLDIRPILKAEGDRISLKRTMFLSERIYQLCYVNPFNRKKRSIILDSKYQDEVNELLALVSDKCGKFIERNYLSGKRRI
ncbi:MAG: hypothetical protein LUB83_05710, partial [Prevotellaceae bacterium]|nr:hypothetical protein [Prevotellaceae bacterium]